MALYGTLRTMPVPELLRWISTNGKTGVLEVERNHICKRVFFRDGIIAACSSEDPPARFGQHLFSQGKITEEQLREALERQRSSGKNLGSVLREMGAITEDEERRQLAMRGEENLYSLFDWLDAVFRFREDGPRDPYGIEVELSVEEVIARGLMRRDELDAIRQVFPHSGLVLRRSGRELPAHVQSSPRAMRILESVDGERNLAEILLHAHTTEHTVVKFLYTLQRIDVVEIIGDKPVSREFVSILDDQPVDEPEIPSAFAPATPAPEADDLLEQDLHLDLPEDIDTPPAATAGDRAPAPADAEAPAGPAAPAPASASDIEQAVGLLNRGEYSAAITTLMNCYKNRPNDESLKQLLIRAEGSYLQDVRNRGFQPYRIPVSTATGDVSTLGLEPMEAFMMNNIDGSRDVQSLLWITPQRELEVMRTLESLRDKGLIRLKDPETTAAAADPNEVGSILDMG